MTQQNDPGQLAALINRLRAQLDKMHQDDRYSNDDDFFKATEMLDTSTQELSEKLRQMDSNYLAQRGLNLDGITQALDPELDKIDDFISGANQTLKIVAVAEQIAKVIHPLL